MNREELNKIVTNKKSILLLRSLLITESAYEVIDAINDKEAYEELLKVIGLTMEYDKEFFLLKDYIKKTQHIIGLGSDKFSTTKDLRKKENECIISLNSLSVTKNQSQIINGYIGGEICMREYLPYTEELLFSSMADDYSFLSDIQEQLNRNQKFADINPILFLASTSYFTYIIPELYDSNPNCVTMSKNFIKELCKEEPDLKIYAKKVKKRLDLFK